MSYLVYSSLILDASGAVYDLNGRVVIPATDGGALYALESPLTEEKLMFAPYYTNLFVPSGSLS